MKSLSNAFKGRGHETAVLFLATIGLLTGCSTPKAPAPAVIAVKLATPRVFAADASGDHPGPLEQQFRIDTAETHLTRRTETDQPRRIRANTKDRLLLKVDLSDWPEPLRPLARLWVGIGATNTFTTEVTINLNFSQGGSGVSTALNNLTSIGGVAIMGCDFAAQDGDVTVDIENRGLPRDVDYTLHAIVYVPKKLDPMRPPE